MIVSRFQLTIDFLFESEISFEMLSSLNNQVKAQITFHQKFLFVKFDKRMWQKKGYGDKQMAKDIMHIFTIEWA